MKDMNSLIQDFEHYFNETLAIKAVPKIWDGTARLPAYLRDTYVFYQVALFNVACLLMVPRDQEEKTPATIRKHMTQVQDKWDSEVVFVHTAVSSHNRKRLIEQKAPFVIPGNQMYLPMVGIDLREHFRKFRESRPAFSPSTQVLLLHAIYTKENEMLTPSEMAPRLGYAAMTMSRAFDELEQASIGKHSVKGKERCLGFTENGKDLWDKALPFFRTPVKKRFHLLTVQKKENLTRAGLTALAYYSRLAESRNPVYAVDLNGWKMYCMQNTITELKMPEPESTEIELWSYSPALYASNGLVDRLSLYLSLKEITDERVETALQEMMENAKW
jgi:DNA-binding MarR family transcriptional regulator